MEIPKADREAVAKILKDNIHFYSPQIEGFVIHGAIDALLTRERQRAIEFAEWVGEDYETYNKGIYWGIKPGDDTEYTTAELYDLFTQSKT